MLLTCINNVFTRAGTTLPSILFANSLGPDQDRQIVGPDLEPNSLTR